MDAFLTSGQRALRQSVRDYFLRRNPNRDGDGRSEGIPEAGDLPDWLGTLPEGPAGLFERALVIEEVSAVSPSLGGSLFPAGGTSGRSPAEDAAAEIAVSLGTSAALLDACQRGAREKGLFESTLMDHQRTQARLADVLSGLEAARLRAYRAFLLLDRGDVARGEKELARAAERASQVHAAARDLATALLGAGGLELRTEKKERSRL